MTQIVEALPQPDYLYIESEKNNEIEKTVYKENAVGSPEKLNLQNAKVEESSHIQSAKRMQKMNSNKLLMKQKDRYQNNTLAKGMFATLDDSVDELKVIYYASTELGKEDEAPNIKKRKPMKLAPIQTLIKNNSVKVIGEENFHQKNTTQVLDNKYLIFPIKFRDISDINEFVTEAIPKNKKLQATVKRNRTATMKFFSHFVLYMEEESKFILSSWKKSWGLWSTFVLGTKTTIIQQQDQTYYGALTSNFTGSEYNLFDRKEVQPQLIATIIYGNQISCKETPRQVQVYILSPLYRYNDLTGISNTKRLNLKQLYQIKQNLENKKIIKLVNKKPLWDRISDCYVMDFHGRAKYSSVKNTILVEANNKKNQVLILGKVGLDSYNMDVMYPLSPRVALAIASTSFDFKWVCQ